MKPILHIVKNRDDKQAVGIISTQARDNAYGVAVVFVQDAVSTPPVDGASAGSRAGTSARFSRRAGIAR